MKKNYFLHPLKANLRSAGNRTALLACLTFFFCLQMFAVDLQEPITGTVADENGMLLPGVTVMVKGTSRGTTTNFDGEYSLQASEDDILVFSFIGFLSQEVAVGDQQEIHIVLQENISELEETVVIGFGTQKKVSVVGAVSTVSTAELQRSPNPSLSNSIGGRLPGIITRQASGEPGFDAAQIFIRGLGTWAHRAPLVLIDGVERDLNSINAQEIESFSVLKDAAATAVYGVRGANGVVLITTKRGEKGKPTVTFRTESAILSALRMPEYINGYEYAGLINEGLVNIGQDPRYTPEELEKFRTGSDPYLYPNVDWVDEVLKMNTFQTINNLSVSGGGDKVRYYTNIGYTLQNGIYQVEEDSHYNTNAQIKRYNYRSNVDIDLSDDLTMELGVGGIIQHRNYPGTSAPDIFGALRTISPIQYPVFNPDGSLGGGLSWLGANPYGQVMRSGYAVQDRNTLQGTFGANWDLSSLITEGLSLDGKFSYDHFYGGYINRHKQYELKQYTGKDADGNDLYNLIREEQPLGYEVGNEANRAVYNEVSLQYDRSFGKHEVTGLALYNRREYIEITAENSTMGLPYRREGMAGRLTYGFDDRYLLELNVGYNGSENFPEGKRFGLFPSVAAGYVISNEPFWNSDVVNHFKLRGSYGQVGNDQIGQRFIYNTTINRNGHDFPFGRNQSWYQGFEEALIGNPNVTWEVATKTNLGLDIQLFDGIVDLQANVFHEDREGILLQRRDVVQATGIFPWVVPFANRGKVVNKGFDSQLEIQDSHSSGFFYSLRGTFTFARNEVIENDEPTPLYDYQAREGKRIDQPFGLVSLGLFQSQEEINNSPRQTFTEVVRPGDIKYQDMNGDGVIDTYDEVAIGHPRTPEIVYGFGGTLGYKAFELSAFFSGAANTSLFIDGPSMYPFERGSASYNVRREYYDNRWTPDNPDGYYPGVINGENRNSFRTSTHYLQDASYLRLKNAEIAYNVPESLTNKLKMNALRIFINGTNLVTWDEIDIINPESNYGTGGYPLQRAVNFGLQVTF